MMTQRRLLPDQEVVGNPPAGGQIRSEAMSLNGQGAVFVFEVEISLEE